MSCLVNSISSGGSSDLEEMIKEQNPFYLLGTLQHVKINKNTTGIFELLESAKIYEVVVVQNSNKPSSINVTIDGNTQSISPSDDTVTFVLTSSNMMLNNLTTQGSSALFAHSVTYLSPYLWDGSGYVKGAAVFNPVSNTSHVMSTDITSLQAMNLLPEPFEVENQFRIQTVGDRSEIHVWYKPL